MRIITAIFLVFNLIGCATVTTNSSKIESPNIRIYDFDSQIVIDKLLSILYDSKTPIVTLNKDKGIITTQRVQIDVNEFKRIGNLPSRDEAGGFRQPWLWARYSQEYKIRSVNNRTEVKIKIHLEGYNASGARWITVISNGAEEKEILDELQTRLQKNS